ncbi:MAG: AraC family transcriptional regulator [Blastopirellula sp.]|nr:MAG: AraC family transcriptional regulator [Blastopirellula sp.]
MAEFLSTDSVSRKDRFGFWREAVCDSYVQLDCCSNVPECFSGEIILNRMSQISASFVSGSQQVVTRRNRDISRSTEASFLISLQLNKNCLVEQSGREANISPGDFVLYSSTDRYSLNLPDGFRQLVIQIPRTDLIRRLPNADVLTGITVSGQSVFGGLISDGVLKLVSAIDQSNEIVKECMQNTIVDLFVTGLATLDQAKFELSRPEQQVMFRANAYLWSNLSNPNLDRAMLASFVGLSVRRLSEIYQADGISITATIRKMRLSKIASDLLDKRYSRYSISEIAHMWGVLNLQSLARSFKSEFGLTPSDYRAASKIHRTH